MPRPGECFIQAQSIDETGTNFLRHDRMYPGTKCHPTMYLTVTERGCVCCELRTTSWESRAVCWLLCVGCCVKCRCNSPNGRTFLVLGGKDWKIGILAVECRNPLWVERRGSRVDASHSPEVSSFRHISSTLRHLHVGTWGRGDVGTWGRGDVGTWGRCEVGEVVRLGGCEVGGHLDLF